MDSVASNAAPPVPNPYNSPENCPGTQSEEAGTTAACAGCPNQSICASLPRGPDPDLPVIADRFRRIKHVILVLSGKGGVGKSTIAVQLASSLAYSDGAPQVGLCDIDICGPSVPRMVLGDSYKTDSIVHSSSTGFSPVYPEDNLAVMSVGFLLQNESDAVIWRGPKKNGMIKTFLRDVDWGSDLDYLIVDTPPGTSDEHLSIVSLLRDAGVRISGAVLVTTPQTVACADVRREATFCQKVSIPILGIVENMSGFVCSHCNQSIARDGLFTATHGGAERLCQELGVPLLGRVPVDRRLMQACDDGVGNFLQLYKDSVVANCLSQVVANVLQAVSRQGA